MDHLERGRPFQGNSREQRLVMDEGYIELVLSTVEQIPPGQVASYGDIAELVGVGGPRLVGRVMSLHGSGVPWWRVVRATVGRFAAWRNRRSSCCDAMGHRCRTAGWTCGRLGCARRPIRTPDCTRWRRA